MAPVGRFITGPVERVGVTSGIADAPNHMREIFVLTAATKPRAPRHDDTVLRFDA